jgi:predicted GNAT family N-acyltransferase
MRRGISWRCTMASRSGRCEAALAAARAGDAEAALLHAQTHVQGFYARLGFVAFGPEFVEDGILHVAMSLPLRGHARRERVP